MYTCVNYLGRGGGGRPFLPPGLGGGGRPAFFPPGFGGGGLPFFAPPGLGGGGPGRPAFLPPGAGGGATRGACWYGVVMERKKEEIEIQN